ncbi:MAG: FAD:protein FMN transferase [Calditrichaeota bacterium]|nr:MAG: FAD:protein FMN transferase [Calditrichota bacterium]MBL1205199.1 FAD:protein FMN transferase [Calditrichota bacterium]NOG45029.1 FAD:protein FMN transferase [Calditrichota bacterium]
MKDQDDKSINIQPSLNQDNVHSFSHFAMATVYEIMISHKDSIYAEQAAQAAFEEIDRLELELSRFIENSDIARINAMSKNEEIIIGPDALECLVKCFEIKVETNGAFDISIGSNIDLWKNKSTVQKTDPALLKKVELQIDIENFRVTLLSENANLDLGGFGKGYAIDRVHELLLDWGIESGFIHGGSSSALAFGSSSKNECREISFTHPENKSVLYKAGLTNMALSGSGISKENHIINPGTMEPVQERLAAWVFAETAAASDALSTAFMIMPGNEINKYCEENKNVSAIILEKEQTNPKYIGEYFKQKDL